MAQDEDQPADANKLAQELANPVANLWSLQFQFNNFQLTNDRWNYNLNFQPVMPVSLTSCWNLITRPVIQVYNSAPYQTSTGADARTTNFGDWTRLEPFSPVGTGDWLLAAASYVQSFGWEGPSIQARESSRSGPRSSSPT